MMEYAKDEIFTIRYNKETDELEYPIQKTIREKIRKNKILSLFFMIGLTFMVIDIVFIYYFFSLLIV